ncbi:hypothetical protein [Methanohalophilus halophilus]|uniref:Uncharacterized protein n=1 Tax=Methanohalophilus halophilus TaxID=2177 RepID=A0A1L3Q3M8_9EURY|nr:hypothetical protein [Methanohalophilus halophilus]APH39469.1 hypothetical protein BHR79_08235 [Methanohalophilus halophilus]RNI07758.1 hypothetical protein EFE40_09450 [Methanohalophilus halophilus]SDW98989.1 hypothetical protein SAMN04515625_2033 [Methanohalophilus halophilus]
METDAYFLPDVPQMLTVLGSNDLNWKHGTVTFDDKGIWLPSTDGWELIPTKAIEIVGRKLPPTFLNKVKATCDAPESIAIDYQKKSFFSSRYITTSLVFAAEEESITAIRHYFNKEVGLQKDAILQELNNEHLKMLLLLAKGINRTKMLATMFDNKELLVKKLLKQLISMGFIDESANLKPRGMTYINEFFGEHTQTNKESDFPDGDPEKTCVSGKLTEGNVWIEHSRNGSFVSGNVSNSDLFAFIPVEIQSVKMGEMNENTQNLTIYTAMETKINLHSKDRVLLSAIYIALERTCEPYYRILSFLYTGNTDEEKIATRLAIPLQRLNGMINNLKNGGYIGFDNTLLSSGFDKLNLQISKINNSSTSYIKHSSKQKDLNRESERKKLLEKIGGIQ